MTLINQNILDELSTAYYSDGISKLYDMLNDLVDKRVLYDYAVTVQADGTVKVAIKQYRDDDFRLWALRQE